MVKISKGDYSLARKITRKTTNPSFLNIIKEVSNGDVWINDIEKPLFALVYSSVFNSYLILGRQENENDSKALIRFLEDEFFIHLKTIGIKEFEFVTDDINIEKLLLNHFKNRISLETQNR